MTIMDRTKLVSAGALAGTVILNHQDEELGHLDDLAIDLEEGAIRFAVVKSGGVLGLGGDKLVAVPWDALEYSWADEHFVIDMEKSVFDSAPTFERAHWPVMSDVRWSAAVTDFFGRALPMSDFIEEYPAGK